MPLLFPAVRSVDHGVEQVPAANRAEGDRLQDGRRRRPPGGQSGKLQVGVLADSGSAAERDVANHRQHVWCVELPCFLSTSVSVHTKNEQQ